MADKSISDLFVDNPATTLKLIEVVDDADQSGAMTEAVLQGLIGGGGQIGQVKFAIFTSVSLTNIINPLTDVPNLSITLTPASINSEFIVLAMLAIGGTTGAFTDAFLNRDGTLIGIGDAAGNRTRVTQTVQSKSADDLQSMILLTGDIPSIPATPIPITYKVQFRSNNGFQSSINQTANDVNIFNYPRASSALVVLEKVP